MGVTDERQRQMRKMEMRDREERDYRKCAICSVPRGICMLTVGLFLYLKCIKIKSKGRKKQGKGRRTFKA